MALVMTGALWICLLYQASGEKCLRPCGVRQSAISRGVALHDRLAREPASMSSPFLFCTQVASAHARTIKPHPPSRISILRVYIRPPPQRSRATELNCSTQLEGKNQDACYLLLHERHWEPGGKEIHTFTTRSCLHKFCEYSTFNCKSKWLATSFFWRWI